MGNQLNCVTDKDDNVLITDQEAQISILMLGAGDGGKSTLFKQLQIIYRDAFRVSRDRQEYTSLIIENVIQAIQTLVNASIVFQIPMTTSINAERLEKVCNLDPKIVFKAENRGWSCLPLGFTPNDIYELWRDPGIQKTFARRNEFHLDDNAPYFLDSLHRLTDTNYVPTIQDILRSRRKSVGMVDEVFKLSNSHVQDKFKVVDVGGQRNERKKWITQFDNVDAVVYVCSLSEFDQLMWEDDKTQRLEDSIRLFKNFYSQLSSIDIYLVMNKEDILMEKIGNGRSMKAFFPDFLGNDRDPNSIKEYVKMRFFKEDTESRIRDVFSTNAVDEQSVRMQVTRIVESIVERRNEVERESTSSSYRKSGSSTSTSSSSSNAGSSKRTSVDHKNLYGK